MKNSEWSPTDGSDGASAIPTLRQLFIAYEQPGESDPQTVAFLQTHPEIQRFIERQIALERMVAERVRRSRNVLPPESYRDADGE